MRIAITVFAFALVIQAAPVADAQRVDARTGNHAVFVMTNSARRNEIIAYSRAKDGSLVEQDHYPTGGRGSGGTTDPLGSQGSLTLSQDSSLLVAVNAGSGEISVFRVRGANLDLAQVVSSGGSAPVAVAQHDGLVYVVNFAGNSNVVGFRLNEAGTLSEIPRSIRYLSTANSGPSSLAFSPDGRFLIVTEKLTNNIDTFLVGSDGSLSGPKITQDPLPGLFDVVFSPYGAALIVQTGPVGGSNASSISSYLVEDDGTLAPITAGVPTLGSGACWVELTPNGQFAYTANSASSSLSAFAIDGSGDVSAVAGTVVASLPAGATDLDIAISQDGKYLYSLNTGTGTVGVFEISASGALKLFQMAAGVKAQAGFNGIAAF